MLRDSQYVTLHPFRIVGAGISPDWDDPVPFINFARGRIEVGDCLFSFEDACPATVYREPLSDRLQRSFERQERQKRIDRWNSEEEAWKRSAPKDKSVHEARDNRIGGWKVKPVVRTVPIEEPWVPSPPAEGSGVPISYSEFRRRHKAEEEASLRAWGLK